MGLLSLVVPVYNEGDNIARLFAEIAAKIHVPHEIIVVYDFEEDNTLPVLRERFSALPNLRLVKNPKRGVLSAIKTGLQSIEGEAAVVVMADVSDDLVVVDRMFELMQAGYDVVCGSRYMEGGAQRGGPFLKSLMSRFAGVSLHTLTGIPTRDITNSFKMYSRKVIERFPLESDGGFELGMELTMKAYMADLRVTEVPSVWTDRAAGKSNFKLVRWLPKYLRWYFLLLKRKPPTAQMVESLLWRASFIGAFLALLVYGGMKVAQWAVDVPYWDEWEALHSNELGHGFHWSWLWAQHNEHRIVLTKLQTLLLWHLDGWNLATHQIWNYWIFGAAMIGFWLCWWRRAAAAPLWAWAAFCIFLLSPRDVANHTWGFQSQFTFAWVFGLAMVALVFDERPSRGRLTLGALSGVLAIISFSGAVGEVAVACVIYSLFRLVRIRSRGAHWRRELRDWAVVVVPCVVTILLWSYDHQPNPAHPPMMLPTQGDYWSFFLSLVSWGFAVDSQAASDGFWLAVLVVLPSLILIVRDRGRGDARAWYWAAQSGVVLAFLGVITAGRAGFHDLHLSKESRYAEIAMLLIPATVGAWAVVLRARPLLRLVALSALWVFCYQTHAAHWNFDAYYAPEAQHRNAGLDCLGAYYAGRGGPLCGAVYPWEMKDMLDNAKLQGTSFYRHLTEKK